MYLSSNKKKNSSPSFIHVFTHLHFNSNFVYPLFPHSPSLGQSYFVYSSSELLPSSSHLSSHPISNLSTLFHPLLQYFETEEMKRRREEFRKQLKERARVRRKYHGVSSVYRTDKNARSTKAQQQSSSVRKTPRKSLLSSSEKGFVRTVRELGVTGRWAGFGCFENDMCI